ncbi:hypothetical protein Cal6303_2033 [Calothrix sp. PCC 6303]|nr:hypothetical protein Cal6303_2033 [Calothrix sp. PCC 6303]
MAIAPKSKRLMSHGAVVDYVIIYNFYFPSPVLKYTKYWRKFTFKIAKRLANKMLFAQVKVQQSAVFSVIIHKNLNFRQIVMNQTLIKL